MIFVIIDTVSGRILQSGIAPEGPPVELIEDPVTQELIEVDRQYSCNHHWFDGVTFQERVLLAAGWDTQTIDADGVDTATLTGLPVPCQVHVDGVPYDVDDGSFEFTAVAPGDYHIWVDHPEYLTQGWIIDAD